MHLCIRVDKICSPGHLIPEDCVNLKVVNPALVIPGAARSTFMNKAAFFGHAPRGSIFRVDHEPDAVCLQAAKQIAHHQSDRLRRIPVAPIGLIVYLVGEFQFIQVIHRSKEFDMTQHFPNRINNEQRPFLFLPETLLLKTSPELDLRNEAQGKEIASIGNLNMPGVEFLQVGLEDGAK
jgi:hypothetical protein